MKSRSAGQGSFAPLDPSAKAEPLQSILLEARRCNGARQTIGFAKGAALCWEVQEGKALLATGGHSAATRIACRPSAVATPSP